MKASTIVRVALASLIGGALVHAQADPLPSWNDGFTYQVLLSTSLEV